jgi:hypothetical protein
MGFNAMPDTYVTLVREAVALRHRIATNDERMKALRAALRDIARSRIMDSVTAIRMRAIAASALWPEDTRH